MLSARTIDSTSFGSEIRMSRLIGEFDKALDVLGAPSGLYICPLRIIESMFKRRSRRDKGWSVPIQFAIEDEPYRSVGPITHLE